MSTSTSAHAVLEPGAEGSGRAEHERVLALLVARVAGGDKDALAQLYDRTGGLVFGLALRILSDAGFAEDATQEVYVQVWRTAKRYDPDHGTVLSWLVTMVRSRSLDCLRSRKAPTAGSHTPVATAEVKRLSEAHLAPQTAARQTSRADTILCALATLVPGQRQAIELAFFGGLSEAEIASRTASPLGTVKARIRTGMAHLRMALEPGTR